MQETNTPQQLGRTGARVHDPAWEDAFEVQLTGEMTATRRRTLEVDLELPWGAEFDLALGRLWEDQPFADRA